MIIMKELNPHEYETDDATEKNIRHLLAVLNIIRARYGKPMRITSGLRSQEDQQRVNPKAPKSKHLLGQAADVYDPNHEFYDWCMANMDLMVELDMYFENKAATPTWCHIQTASPKSGKRVFNP